MIHRRSILACSDRLPVERMSNTSKVFCEQCGTTTAFTIFREGSVLITVISQGTEKPMWMTWRVLVCSVCSRPILEREMHPVGDALEGKPPHRLASDPFSPTRHIPLGSLPPLIARMYRETVRVKDRSPRACAVMAGLTLEAACQHEHAKGRSLAEYLNTLVAAERLPKILADLAHSIPQLRTIGSHLTRDEVVPEDVPIILDFVETILASLYEAPANHGADQERRATDDLC